MRRSFRIGIAAVLAAAATLASPAEAWRDHGRGPGFDRRGDGPGPGYFPRGQGFYRRGPGGPPRGPYDRRHRCRDNGAGGTILGAIAGGLLGNSVAGRGDRTTGAIVGGGLGALAGRAIDRDC